MLRSKDIAEYVEALFQDLRPGVALPFDIHLYFQRNRHVMLWRKEGDVPSEDFVAKYRERGVRVFWVHKSQEPALRRYLEAQGLASAPGAMPQAMVAEAPPEPPRTAEGAFLAEVMNSQDLSQEQKKAIVQESARGMLAEAAQAKTRDEQKAADKKLKRTVQDVLDSGSRGNPDSIAGQIYAMAGTDADLEHSVNAATYAVVLAMAFGRIDAVLVADIALAGLLHDVGICQVPAHLVPSMLKEHRSEDPGEYGLHVDLGLGILTKHAPHVSQRVRTILHQHHEKFDGTGYPQRLRGFKVDDIAQLLSLANLLDAVCSGAWDGVERTLKEGFDEIEKMEQVRTFPEFFNPDVFSAVMRWLRKTTIESAMEKAAQVVSEQVKGVI